MPRDRHPGDGLPTGTTTCFNTTRNGNAPHSGSRPPARLVVGTARADWRVTRPVRMTWMDPGVPPCPVIGMPIAKRPQRAVWQSRLPLPVWPTRPWGRQLELVVLLRSCFFRRCVRCPLGRSVGRSVGLSVGLSVGRSVGRSFDPLDDKATVIDLMTSDQMIESFGPLVVTMAMTIPRLLTS